MVAWKSSRHAFSFSSPSLKSSFRSCLFNPQSTILSKTFLGNPLASRLAMLMLWALLANRSALYSFLAFCHFSNRHPGVPLRYGSKKSRLGRSPKDEKSRDALFPGCFFCHSKASSTIFKAFSSYISKRMTSGICIVSTGGRISKRNSM